MSFNIPYKSGGPLFTPEDPTGYNSHSLSAATPLILTPAAGKAILLTGLTPTSNTAQVQDVTVSGSVQGDYITSQRLMVDGNLTGSFFIGQTSGTVTATVAATSCIIAPKQYGKDEVVTISTLTAGSATVYWSSVEGVLS